jgi:hypothetical protein
MTSVANLKMPMIQTPKSFPAPNHNRVLAGLRFVSRPGFGLWNFSGGKATAGDPGT